MKKFLQISVLALAVSALTISTAPAQAKKAQSNQNQNQNQNQGGGQGAISKADAERRVSQRFPGATIVNTVETTKNGHKAWAVSFSTTGAPAARKAYVDEETGKLSY